MRRQTFETEYPKGYKDPPGRATDWFLALFVIGLLVWAFFCGGEGCAYSRVSVTSTTTFSNGAETVTDVAATRASGFRRGKYKVESKVSRGVPHSRDKIEVDLRMVGEDQAMSANLATTAAAAAALGTALAGPAGGAVAGGSVVAADGLTKIVEGMAEDSLAATGGE